MSEEADELREMLRLLADIGLVLLIGGDHQLAKLAQPMAGCSGWRQAVLKDQAR